MQYKAYSYILVTPAGTTPVSLAEVKEHLKLDASDASQDTYLTLLINSCTAYGEKYTKRDFITKTYRTYRNGFYEQYYEDGYTYQKHNAFLLRRSKATEIVTIKYLKSSVLTLVSNTIYYLTDEADWGEIYLVDGQSWPSDVDNRKQAVQIEFKAGYGIAASDVPKDIRLALLNHIAKVYENRGDCDMDTADSSLGRYLPKESEQIYNLYRIHEIIT